MNENVINQGLFYLDWLLDHKAEFELMVMRKYGPSAIDWSSPRLLCIAGGFTKYDEHAVQQINRNIELYQYKHYIDGLLLLDLVNSTTDLEASSLLCRNSTFRYSSKVMDEKIMRYEAYFHSNEWQKESWQPSNKKVFPSVIMITDTHYDIQSSITFHQVQHIDQLVKMFEPIKIIINSPGLQILSSSFPYVNFYLIIYYKFVYTLNKLNKV